MKRYWVDSSSLIWANKDLFPYNDVRGYWNWLETKMGTSIVSHKRVWDEVIKGAEGERPDPIAVWLKSRKDKGFNYGCTHESKVVMGEISTYVVQEYRFEVAKAFLKCADPHLISRAAVDGGVVVTQESQTKEPRIPKICRKFDIECIPLTKMNILLGMKF